MKHQMTEVGRSKGGADVVRGQRGARDPTKQAAAAYVLMRFGNHFAGGPI